jgi:hypothetical protein
MMKKNMANRGLRYTIDLTQIEGDGSFPCPKCGTVISPEDETEELYKILDTKVIDDRLAELIVECRSCSSVIKLTGFQQTVEDATNE